MMKKIQNVKNEVVDIVEDIKGKIDGLKKEDFSIAELDQLIGRMNHLQEQTFVLKYLLSSEQQLKEEKKQADDEKIASMKAEEEAIKKEEKTSKDSTDSEKVEETPLAESETNEMVVEEPKEEESREESPAQKIASEEDKNVNAPDLNEVFSAKDDPSLSGQLRKQPVADLLTAIGLNERYLYANELFAGNIDEFREAIRMLNEFDDLEKAKEYFNNELKRNYDWEDDNELSEALMSLVERRYL